MAGRKSDFTLTKLDGLFSTQEQRDEEKLSKIRDIPLTEIDDFHDHPFKVRDDEDMAQLVESSLNLTVYIDDNTPYIAAFEVLRTCSYELPNLSKFLVPSFKGIFEILNYPIITRNSAPHS